jgi:predicted NBD/HSP70 family sugar kinase
MARKGIALGLAVAERAVRVVAVSPAGAVVGRAVSDDPSERAVREAIGSALAATRERPVACGVAGDDEGDHSGSAWLRGVLPEGVTPVPVAPGEAVVAAETALGAARGVRSFAAVWLGDHVVGGLVLDGRRWTGDHGMAGGLGWMALNPVEREDYRRLGGLEADVASAGITKRFVWRIKSGDHSSALDAVGGDLSRVSVAHVFDGARGGDAVCISIVRDTSRYLGMAIANLVTLLDPSLVVLGGIVAAAGDLMLEPIRTECARRVRPAVLAQVQLVVSPLGEDALAAGAALAAAPAAARQR